MSFTYVRMYYLAPSSVQNALVTLVDSNLINITWSSPAIPNGIIQQYIVKRINSSGVFYDTVSGNQHHILLSYFNDALVFISAVNTFGQGNYVQAKPNGTYTDMKTNLQIMHMCAYIFSSLSSIFLH